MKTKDRLFLDAPTRALFVTLCLVDSKRLRTVYDARARAGRRGRAPLKTSSPSGLNRQA